MRQLYIFLLYFFAINISYGNNTNPCPDPPPVAEFEVEHHDCISLGTVTVNYPLGSQYEYSISGITYPGGAPYQTAYQSNPVFNNLPWGDYQVTVKESDCTSTTSNIIVNRFYPLSSTHYADCYNETGSITVYSPFVAPQFEYSIDGTNYIGIEAGDNYYVFENLIVGQTYTVYLRDVINNCVVTRTTTIPQILQEIDTPTIVVSQPDCLNQLGSITITSPISWNINEYSIDGGQNYQFSPVFENLEAGAYEVMVKRGVQCFSEMVEVIINSAPNPIPIPTAISSLYCGFDPEVNPGTIIITSPLGSQYQYSIDGINYQESPLFENLPLGNYDITAKGDNDCISEAVSVEINDSIPTVPTPEAFFIPIACNDIPEDLGTLVITYPLGNEYEYSIDGINYQSSPIIQPWSWMGYPLSVTVRNEEGCVSEALIINESDGIIIPIADIIQPDCNEPPESGQTGTITVTFPLGDIFQYSIDGVNYQDSPVFLNIFPGTYQLTFRLYHEYCISDPLEIIISNDNLPLAPEIVVTNNCGPFPGGNAGTIIIISPLGNQYTYSIDGVNYQSNPTFENLPSGTYQVSVRENNCFSEITTVEISGFLPVIPTPQANIIQPDCSDVPENWGQIIITYPLGNEYEYSIDGINYQQNPSFINISIGTYQVTAKYINSNCVSEPLEATINFVEVPTPQATVIPIICSTIPEDMGVLIITYPLGDNYQYSIDNINYQNSPVFQLFNSNFPLTITARIGECVSEAIEINNNEGDSAPIADIAQPDCNEPPESGQTGTITVTFPLGDMFQYSIDGINYQNSPVFINVFPGTYQLTFRLYEYCVSEPLEIIIEVFGRPETPTANVIHPTCDNPFGTIEVTSPIMDFPPYMYSINGIDYQFSPIFENLSSGTYQITTKLFEQNCVSEILEVTLDDISDVPTPVVNITQPDCNDSYGTILITNHTVHTYQFSINGEDYQISPIFENLPSGVYPVTIKSGDCISDTLDVIINELPEISINLFSICENENRFLLKAETQSQENYQYLWNTGQTDSSIEITQIGNYSVMVSLDNCSEEFFIDIDSIPCMIPRGISPNGDFLNDEFDLSGFGTIPKVQIFNRYGMKVYSQTNYSNQWKGQTDKGSELPTGTYYYLINFQNGTQKTGWVYLNREI